MSKKNVSRSSIPVKKGKTEMLVKIINGSIGKETRKLQMNAYDKDSEQKESLPIYLNDKRTHTATLKPGGEQIYKIDVSGVNKKVVFEAIQMKGGSGLSVKSKNSGTINAEIKIK
ncbi:hypothetical protein J2S78_003155 [Salibacterium salarium]|uniref:hypothetical protein n=1 Tax=Salibacterium salarium TaxID=284579 RepID=UPI0027812F20|nr:hypothetical protein [Salibacterium salarium]MDQ0300687.1 hypothetical protein [Salibacterium salarium]